MTGIPGLIAKTAFVLCATMGAVRLLVIDSAASDGAVSSVLVFDPDASFRGTTSSPALGLEGSIYFGSRGDDAGEPAPLFRLKEGRLTEMFRAGDDINGTPAVGPDGAVYFGSWDGNFVALNPDGTKRWDFSVGRAIESSAAIGPDGTIVFGASDGKLHALGPDGSEKWAFCAGDWIQSSPAVGVDSVVYFGSWLGEFFAVGPDGSEKWRFSADRKIVSSPALDRDGAVYVGSSSGAVHALWTVDGREKWSHQTSGPIEAGIVIGIDGSILAGSVDGNLYALDPADGSLRWKTDLDGPVVTTPVVRSDGSIIVGGAGRKVHCLGFDGTVRWQVGTGGVVDASPLIDSAGRVVFTASDGTIRIINGEVAVANGVWPAFRGNMARSGAMGTESGMMRSSQLWQNTHITVTEDSFVFVFDATVGEGVLNGLTGLSGDPADEYSDLAVAVRFSPDGTIDARNGNTFSSNARVEYESGGRYRFLVFVDLTNRRYSVDVEVNGSVRQLARDFAFRTEQSGLERIGYVAAFAGAGGHLVENISVGAMGIPIAPGNLTIIQ